MSSHAGFSRFLSNLSVRHKLNLLVALIALGVILLAVVAARIQYLDLNETRKSELQSRVGLTLGILDRYAAMAKSGEMEVAQAQATALKAIEGMRANQDADYFYIHDMTPVMLMHPFRKDLVGKNIGDIRSADGLPVFTDQVEAARKGGGFISFTWAKPGKDKPVQKIAYAAPYADWGWVIASGVYMDDVQNQAIAFTWVMTLAGGALILIVLLLSWVIGNRIVVPLQRATGVAEAIAQGRLDNSIGEQARDEPGRLLECMGRMQTQLQRFSSETALMIELHADKDMTHRMPLDFPGVYGDLSKGINTMMFEHLDAIVDAIAVLNEYANGDLRRDARRLPGSRVVLHESMDAAKASLMAINTEIKRLAAAAAAGDFSVRGDEQKFQYDFQVMVQGLNTMMGVSDHSLGQLSSLLKSIAAGDLTARMHGDYNGVFASMRDDANATASQLADIVGQIRTGSDAINTAASEISSGNSDLAQRTEQQAANLEETAASMEELTSTVRQNAESARQANQLAIGAASVASQGGEVVGQVVTTMSAIQTSSKKIAEIISVIDGIAFQTNILALNAAVEAARAGEQGRGFAVVASEVRTLAQRSAAAAKEIKGLIEDSVERVSDGSALVDKAGQTMGEIVASVQRVTDIMSEISAASQEQSAGIEQVNQTITQMDETTQQNAALVEEASAAARSMEEQAEQLVQTVAVFRLEENHAAEKKSPGPASASVTRLPLVGRMGSARS